MKAVDWNVYREQTIAAEIEEDARRYRGRRDPDCLDKSSFESQRRAIIRGCVCSCPRRFDRGDPDGRTPGERASEEADLLGQRRPPRYPDRCARRGWWHGDASAAPRQARQAPTRLRGGGSSGSALEGADGPDAVVIGQVWVCESCRHRTTKPRTRQAAMKSSSWSGHGAIREEPSRNPTEDAVIAWIDDRLPQIRRERDHAEATPHRRADRSRSR